ncbi:MAG TPA: hypothetical protein PK866_04605, partial [Nitrospira sp.]|nr:hypothetical protein [Nitrospira sp.]
MTALSRQTFLNGPPQPLVVVRPLPKADVFELYQRLTLTDGPSFLLESGNGTQATARYSFIGSHPYLTLTGGAQNHHLGTDGHTTTSPGSVFDAFRQAFANATIPRPDGLPPFFGGAVGYLSYDLVRSFESLPTLAADDLGLPDLHMAFFDLLAAVDHHTNQLYLMYCPPLSRFRAEPREKLFREGC